MGHVGLTPQTATALGGYRSQGRTAERALEVCQDALALQEAGCFAIVFEAIPSDVTELIMPKLEVPVIGIGAGPSTDGQVLVFHDLLGIYDGHAARFVKRYANVRRGRVVAGVDGAVTAAAGPRWSTSRAACSDLRASSRSWCRSRATTSTTGSTTTQLPRAHEGGDGAGRARSRGLATGTWQQVV